MTNGFIKLHRSLIKWEWYDDGNTFRVFLHLLLSAQYNPKKWHGIVLAPGQVVTGRVKLSKTLHISQQSVRTSLNKLKSTNEITINITNKYSIISIVNWDLYQASNQQVNQQPTSNQPATNQQLTTYKKDNKVKKDNKDKKSIDDQNSIDELFAEFWKAYPRKVGKKDARKAWDVAIKETSPASILIGARQYSIQSQGKESSWIKHPGGWLRAGRWGDEPEDNRDPLTKAFDRQNEMIRTARMKDFVQ